MLINHSHKFVFIRVPKTASTSCVFYFGDSGLMDPETDVYAGKSVKPLLNICKVAPTGEHKRTSLEIAVGQTPYLHAPHYKIVERYPDTAGYESLACVRNPVDRFCSFVSGHMTNESSSAIEIQSAIYKALDEKKLYPQVYYYGPSTIVWPFETVEEKVIEYITKKGGSVRRKWHQRNSNSGRIKIFLNKDIENSILDFYSKDFELWEKTMAN